MAPNADTGCRNLYGHEGPRPAKAEVSVTRITARKGVKSF